MDEEIIRKFEVCKAEIDPLERISSEIELEESVDLCSDDIFKESKYEASKERMV